MTETYAVFIVKCSDECRFICRKVFGKSDVVEAESSLLENSDWVAFLGTVPVRNDKFPMARIRKLERKWFNAGSSTRIGKLHPRFAAGADVLKIIDDVIAPAANQALTANTGSMNIGLKSLDVTHTQVALLRALAVSAIDAVELKIASRVFTYNVRENNLFEKTDDAVIIARVLKNSSGIAAEILSTKIPTGFLS